MNNTMLMDRTHTIQCFSYIIYKNRRLTVKILIYTTGEGHEPTTDDNEIARTHMNDTLNESLV